MKKIIFAALLTVFSAISFAQVGINTENPNVLTDMDIQNLIKNNGDTVPKGIMIPRMTEAQRNLINVSSAATANSLMIYNTTEDCYNYYSRAEGEWKSICGALGKATFDFDCAAVIPLGTYIEKKELIASNMLKFFVTVTKPGSYSITGTTANGYYFDTSGIFLSAGTFTIYAAGHGTPAVPQVDIVSLAKNGEAVNCTTPVKVTVLTSTATYAINCSSLIANGQYIKGQALTSVNTITLNVNVSNAGSYNITTPVTNGISFTASGNFSVGTQSVTLAAVAGSNPSVNVDFPITVNTDTPEGNNTCTVMIPMTLPKMTYAIIGNNTTYSWYTTQRRTALGDLGASKASFGPTGTVKMVSLDKLWDESNVTTAANRLNSDAVKPDIVLYFAYGSPPNSAVTSALINYINKGGCVIYGSADGTSSSVNTLMSGVFGITTAQAQISGSPSADNNYQIANLPNDPVINGPFGNLSGRYWGEDNESNGSIIMTALPPNSVQVCSANNSTGKMSVDPDYSIIWYNDSKNFLYFGDSVGSATEGSGNGNATGAYPALFTSTGLPKSKSYGPSSSTQQFIVNSALELNAVAWAIKKAAMSGINPH